MKELSLNILDIAMNSVKAGATRIGIALVETDETLVITISDDGCGMSGQTVKKLRDPFFTTRTTRKVGLGIPFYILAAEQTGGGVEIRSTEAPNEGHGTEIKATFYKKHIDYTPLGDVVSTIMTLIHGYPDIDLEFSHSFGNQSVSLKTAEVKRQIGDIPINSFEILDWIKQYLLEQYQQL